MTNIQDKKGLYRLTHMVHLFIKLLDLKGKGTAEVITACSYKQLVSDASN